MVATLRDCEVAAPLKLLRAGFGQLVGVRSPRLRSRGPIEAGRPPRATFSAPRALRDCEVAAPLKPADERRDDARAGGSPRLRSRGPIEAAPPWMPSPWRWTLRDCEVAAP